MKKLTVIAMVAASVLIGGCRYDKALSDDGKPVAPNGQSYERSQRGEPQLPYMKPWWKN